MIMKPAGWTMSPDTTGPISPVEPPPPLLLVLEALYLTGSEVTHTFRGVLHGEDGEPMAPVADLNYHAPPTPHAGEEGPASWPGRRGAERPGTAGGSTRCWTSGSGRGRSW